MIHLGRIFFVTPFFFFVSIASGHFSYCRFLINMVHRPMLSVLELLDLFAALGAVILTAVSALLTGLPGRGPDDEPSLYLHVCYAATRKLLARCSAEQLQ